MDEKLKQQAEWCKSICPDLAAFNIAYIVRKGQGLIPRIELRGTDADIMYCVEQEAKLFFNAGFMRSADVCKRIDDILRLQIIYLKDDRNLKEGIKAGNLYFFKHCNANPKNIFFVDGCSSSLRISSLAADFGMDENQLTEILKNYPEWQRFSTAEVINRTLIEHYKNSLENSISDNDFSWLAHEKQKNSSNHIQERKVSEDKNKSNLNSEKGRSSQQAATNETTPSESLMNQKNKHEKTQDAEPEKVDIKKENDSSDVPAPKKKTEIKEVTGTVKESLSDDECMQNEELLANIVKEYEDVMKYIDDLKNSKWRFLINKMRDVLEKRKFNLQWCPMYLEISDDLSDELYAKLYDLDDHTLKFNQRVIHQVIHLGCPTCGQSWDEDITFADPGIHDVECPYCYSGRRYEKKVSRQ